MVEKLMKKVANSQAFCPEDRLSQMVKNYAQDELDEDSLYLVCAAGKEDASYAEFLKLVQEKDGNRK